MKEMVTEAITLTHRPDVVLCLVSARDPAQAFNFVFVQPFLAAIISCPCPMFVSL